MKWFKHLSTLSGQDDIQGLEQKFGLPGYARLLKIYEAVAEAMDASDQCSLTLTLTRLETLLAGKRKQLLEYLGYLHSTGLIILEADEVQTVIKCPQLLKLRDNHTSNLQVTAKPACKPAVGFQLFSTVDQWEWWLKTELCYLQREVNKPPHQSVIRQWLVSHVTTLEVEQAVDEAVQQGIDIKQLDQLHRLIAQHRKQKIMEAREQ